MPLTFNFKKKPETVEENRYIKAIDITKQKPKILLYENAEKLAKEIKLYKNIRYYVIVHGDFIFGDFIEAFIIENNFKIKELTISTLSLSEDNIDSLHNIILSGNVKKLNLIVSSYFYRTQKQKYPDFMNYLYKKLDIDNLFQFAVCGSHMKTMQFETENGKKCFMSGSANLRSSNSIEQFIIEENSEVYDFHQKFNNEILEKYKTINKAIEYKQLYKLIENDI